jgi:hypothetical protein
MAVNKYITKYEWPLSETLKEAILIQQGIVNEAQNAYNDVFGLGLRAKSGGKSMWIFRYIAQAKGLI